MGAVELRHFANPEMLAQTAATDCLSAIAQHPAGNPPFLLALSGGRISRNFCAALTERAKERGASFNNVHFFWSDERCVPPDDAESNFRLANEALLAPLKIPAANIHRIEGEKPGHQAFAAVEAQLRKLAASTGQTQPRLHLVLLGMGEDGHVASLFPGEPEAVRASAELFRCVIGPKPPPQRITMGFPAIASAERVWVLASGAGKTKALADSLAPGSQTPLARVIQLRDVTRVYTDIAQSPKDR